MQVRKGIDMSYIGMLLASKTIQGILITVAGALLRFFEEAYPEYKGAIQYLEASLISGGAVHGIHGRREAKGPI